MEVLKVKTKDFFSFKSDGSLMRNKGEFNYMIKIY